jgi:protein TonB
MPLAAVEPYPQHSATAPTGVTTNPAPSSTTLPSSGAPSGAPNVIPAKVEQPSSDADYLNNPKPPYPSLSKRLGEQGRVLVRTLIGADGVAQKAEIKQSSGFDRLDQTALATALRWRYVPGKRAGVPEAMWFNVPFNFVLE